MRKATHFASDKTFVPRSSLSYIVSVRLVSCLYIYILYYTYCWMKYATYCVKTPVCWRKSECQCDSFQVHGMQKWMFGRWKCGKVLMFHQNETLRRRGAAAYTAGGDWKRSYTQSSLTLCSVPVLVYIYIMYKCGCTYRVTLRVFSWGTLQQHHQREIWFGSENNLIWLRK